MPIDDVTPELAALAQLVALEVQATVGPVVAEALRPMERQVRRLARRVGRIEARLGPPVDHRRLLVAVAACTTPGQVFTAAWLVHRARRDEVLHAVIAGLDAFEVGSRLRDVMRANPIDGVTLERVDRQWSVHISEDVQRAAGLL